MYHATITYQSWQSEPSQNVIKEALFKHVLQESDLMSQLLDDNKIVVELNLDKKLEGHNIKYEMVMNLTHAQNKNITYNNPPSIDSDYMRYLSWKNKSKWKKLTTLIFQRF